MQKLRVCAKCQVATVLENSFLRAVKESAPEMFASNEPGFAEAGSVILQKIKGRASSESVQ